MATVSFRDFEDIKNGLVRLRMKTLDEYRRSNLWQERRRSHGSHKIGKRCYYCCRSDRKTKLDLHHLTYVNLGRELPHELIWLCKGCHGEVYSIIEKTGVDILEATLKVPRASKSVHKHLTKKLKKKAKNRRKQEDAIKKKAESGKPPKAKKIVNPLLTKKQRKSFSKRELAEKARIAALKAGVGKIVVKRKSQDG